MVYVDEMMVTKSTIPYKEWSHKNTNMKIDYSKFAKEVIASVVAISAERGVDHVSLFDYSVNKDKFKLFL